MKKTTLYFSIITIVLTLFSSCEESLNDDGDTRTKFTGKWTVTKGSGNNQTSFEVNIVKSKVNSTQILMANFHNLGNSDTVIAVVNTVQSNTLTINEQIIYENYVIFDGVGTLTDSHLVNWNYKIDDGNGKNSYEAKMIR